MATWLIYYCSREYAAVLGDPLLGTVEASSKEEAETKARRRGLGGVGGVWAVPEARVRRPQAGAAGGSRADE